LNSTWHNFDKAIQTDPNFAMAYLYRAQSGGGNIVYRQNLNKAVSLIGNVSEGEKLEIQYNQAYADGNDQKQKELFDKLLVSFPFNHSLKVVVFSYLTIYLSDSDM